jgi:hypothetical protein
MPAVAAWKLLVAVPADRPVVGVSAVAKIDLAMTVAEPVEQALVAR